MNKTMLIVLLVISLIATAGAVFVCVQDFSAANLLMAVALVLCAGWFGWQISKKS